MRCPLGVVGCEVDAQGYHRRRPFFFSDEECTAVARIDLGAQARSLFEVLMHEKLGYEPIPRERSLVLAPEGA